MKYATSILFLILAMNIAYSQGDNCPAIVEQALISTDEACMNLGRNQVCYGNQQVSAEGRRELQFESSGDIANLADIQTITTAPLDVESGIWGVALLNVQANIPNTLPGQNVTFVLFGDTTLVNEIDVAFEVQLHAISTGNINVRREPATNAGIVTVLQTNEAVTVVGRNNTGDWVLVQLNEGGTAWVFTSLLTIDGDIAELPLFDSAPQYTNPMQAFQFSSGVGASLCDEAPQDGLLIQSPENITVNFLINGIEVQIGSTALIREVTESGMLQIINIHGNVTISVNGESIALAPGESINVQAGEPLPEPSIYTENAMRALPLNLLPEEVSIPPVIVSLEPYDVVGDGEFNLFPMTFLNPDGDAIVAIQQRLVSATSGTWNQGEIEISDDHYSDPTGGNFRFGFYCQVTQTRTVTYAIALVDEAGNLSPPVEYTVTCSPP